MDIAHSHNETFGRILVYPHSPQLAGVEGVLAAAAAAVVSSEGPPTVWTATMALANSIPAWFGRILRDPEPSLCIDQPLVYNLD